MDAKALTQFIKTASIEAVLLDELHLERSDVPLQGGVNVKEALRSIEPLKDAADRLRIIGRLHLIGSVGTAEQLESGKVPADAPIAFQMSAAVSAIYRCDVANTDPDVVDAFAQTSGVAHLNAYLRQFVQETLARAGFPGVVMPLMPVAAPGAVARKASAHADKS